MGFPRLVCRQDGRGMGCKILISMSRRRALESMAFVALGMLMARNPKGATEMFPAVIYKSNTADDRFETTLSVEPTGAGRLTIGSNRGQPAWPIGRFEAPIPAALQQNLAAALGSGFAASPSQDTLVPDESFREITARSSSTQITKRVGEQLPTPPAFSAAENALKRIIDELIHHPVLSVEVRLDGLPQTAIAGTSAILDLTLRNVGRQRFHLGTPSAWGKSGWHGELSVLRADIPSAALRSEHQKFVQLNASNLVAIVPAQPPGPLRLGPGAAVNARFQLPLDWPPGKYNIQSAVTMSLLNDAQEILFTGSAVTAPRPIEIQPRN